MLIAAATTLLFFPIYLALRWPYFKLPLHVDTGFYVSNHTVATSRIRYAAGWNAHFAGCSKVLPEFFYSLVHLAHVRAARRPGSDYAFWSRLHASIYNYIAAIAVGGAAWLTGGESLYYVTGMVAFGLVSSEPQWGVYFECGELFELPWQIVGFGLITGGVHRGDTTLIALGMFLWVIEACFIKLSSILSTFVLIIGVSILAPWSIPGSLLGGSAAFACYALWVRQNAGGWRILFHRLASHERSYGQRATGAIVAMRLKEKIRRLGQTVRVQPIIPVLAAIGTFRAATGEPIWCIYLIAVFCAFVVQATDCWYYQIPLLPPMALAAGLAAGMLLSQKVGVVVLIFAGALWLVQNAVRTWRLDRRSLARWAWNGQLAERELAANELLHAKASEIGQCVAGRSLLVYGPRTQAYVYAGAAYATPMVAPEYYLDDVCPGWQSELSRRLLASPPAYILDTGDCFDSAAAREGLGLTYRLVRAFGDRLRLFALARRVSPIAPAVDVRTYRPLTASDMLLQSAPIPGDADVCTLDWTPGDPDYRSLRDPIAARLERLLSKLPSQGFTRIALYGAGRFTARYLDVYRASPVQIVVVIDDRPSRHGDTYLGWPVRSPQSAHEFDFDAIVISTDRFAGVLSDRTRSIFDGRKHVISIEDDPAEVRQHAVPDFQGMTTEDSRWAAAPGNR